MAVTEQAVKFADVKNAVVYNNKSLIGLSFSIVYIHQPLK